jgi:hypothetical protein
MTVPFVPFNKYIAHSTIRATVSMNVNIGVKVYRKPPAMSATATMLPCKDPHQGTYDNPYLIYTLADLQALANKGNGTVYNWYALANDIDGAGVTINPINYFYGNLDGRGHTIKNLVMQQATGYVGLFDYFYESNIKDLKLDSIRLTKSPSSSVQYAGVLIGLSSQSNLYITYVKVTNCIFNSDLTSNTYAGGLIGAVNGSKAVITGCSVESTTFTGGALGGLIGSTSANDLLIQSCYTSGNMLSNQNYAVSYAAGLVAYSNSYAYKLTISNCYSRMNFLLASSTAQKIQFVGGLVGRDLGSKITNSFYAGTVSGSMYFIGLVGYNGSPTIINSYVDSTLAGTAAKSITIGTPKTTSQMLSRDTYSNWSFPWAFSSSYNDGYPYFDYNVTGPIVSD